MWMSVVPAPFERFVENLCCCSFFLCKWSVDCVSCGFISGLSVSLIYLSILSPVSPCFDYCRFIVNLKVGQYHLHSKDSPFPPLYIPYQRLSQAFPISVSGTTTHLLAQNKNLGIILNSPLPTSHPFHQCVLWILPISRSNQAAAFHFFLVQVKCHSHWYLL